MSSTGRFGAAGFGAGAAAFLRDLQALEQSRERYRATPPWRPPGRTDLPRVAYFSMEFGLHEALPLYSGGLGVLAGGRLEESDVRAFPLPQQALAVRRGGGQLGIALVLFCLLGLANVQGVTEKLNGPGGAMGFIAGEDRKARELLANANSLIVRADRLVGNADSKVFGDKGAHARSAFGVAQIPMGACVEIDLVAEVA